MAEALVALLITVIAGLILAYSLAFAQGMLTAAGETASELNSEYEQLDACVAGSDREGSPAVLRAIGDDGTEDESEVYVLSGEKSGCFVFR